MNECVRFQSMIDDTVVSHFTKSGKYSLTDRVNNGVESILPSIESMAKTWPFCLVKPRF